MEPVYQSAKQLPEEKKKEEPFVVGKRYLRKPTNTTVWNKWNNTYDDDVGKVAVYKGSHADVYYFEFEEELQNPHPSLGRFNIKKGHERLIFHGFAQDHMELVEEVKYPNWKWNTEYEELHRVKEFIVGKKYIHSGYGETKLSVSLKGKIAVYRGITDCGLYAFEFEEMIHEIENGCNIPMKDGHEWTMMKQDLESSFTQAYFVVDKVQVQRLGHVAAKQNFVTDEKYNFVSSSGKYYVGTYNGVIFGVRDDTNIYLGTFTSEYMLAHYKLVDEPEEKKFSIDDSVRSTRKNRKENKRGVVVEVELDGWYKVMYISSNKAKAEVVRCKGKNLKEFAEVNLNKELEEDVMKSCRSISLKFTKPETKKKEEVKAKVTEPSLPLTEDENDFLAKVASVVNWRQVHIDAFLKFKQAFGDWFYRREYVIMMTTESPCRETIGAIQGCAALRRFTLGEIKKLAEKLKDKEEMPRRVYYNIVHVKTGDWTTPRWLLSCVRDSWSKKKETPPADTKEPFPVVIHYNWGLMFDEDGAKISNLYEKKRASEKADTVVAEAMFKKNCIKPKPATSITLKFS